MSQVTTIPSALIPIGTQTLANVLMVSNSFSKYYVTFDIIGVSSLAGQVATLTVGLSSDGVNFTDFDPIPINGGPIRSNGTTFNIGLVVDPPRTFSRIRAVLNTLQPWTTAITISVN